MEGSVATTWPLSGSVSVTQPNGHLPLDQNHHISRPQMHLHALIHLRTFPTNAIITWVNLSCFISMHTSPTLLESLTL